MTFIDPKTFSDDDLMNIVDDGPNPAHLLYHHPAYHTWLDKCWTEAVCRGLR